MSSSKIIELQRLVVEAIRTNPEMTGKIIVWMGGLLIAGCAGGASLVQSVRTVSKVEKQTDELKKDLEMKTGQLQKDLQRKTDQLQINQQVEKRSQQIQNVQLQQEMIAVKQQMGLYFASVKKPPRLDLLTKVVDKMHEECKGWQDKLGHLLTKAKTSEEVYEELMFITKSFDKHLKQIDEILSKFSDNF